MKVTTKYDLGDNVWFMCQNRPQCFSVRHIYIKVAGPEEYAISYLVNYGSTEYPESALFRTKKELLATL